MNMKKTTIGLLAGMLAGLTIAQDTAPTRPRNPREFREMRIREEGGLLQIPVKDPAICFANAQDKVPAVVLERVAEKMSDLMSVCVIVRAERYESLEKLSAAKATSKHAAIIAIGELKGMPALVISPDAGWSYINMCALSSDNPNPEVLASRVIKEMWRALGQTLGTGWSTTPNCILKSATSNRQLDSLSGKVIGPDGMGRIFNKLRSGEIAPYGTCTYKVACEKGWAPAPTNDVQKSVWNKVHSLPKNPMKIEYNKKKGR